MEQNELRAWEHRCIQEEPPFCQAACPIHVDARALAKALAAGDTSAARAVLERTMPLPGVLGLICDAPCQAACRRKDVGEAIRIGKLERACVRASQPKPLRPLPARGKKVAVLGSGLSSLTVAWDLGKKGYAVELFSPKPGGSLLDVPEDILPRQALADELERLKALRVNLREEMPPQNAQELTREYDAVYVGFDDPTLPDAASLGLHTASNGLVQADPLSLTTDVDGVFAAGLPAREGFSPVALAAQGRKAAVSVDRHIQKVSMTAQRDKEGPFQTRLFTSIKDVEAEPAVLMTDPAGYSPDETQAEAARCLLCDCMECVKVCAYLEHYKGYPKKLARSIFNNLTITHGLRQANKLTNSCSYCGLCATVCPNDFHMGDFCAQARAEMVRTSKMPPSAHDFALRDLEFNTSPAASLTLPGNPPAGETCGHVFFPGCQLSGAAPDHVLRTLEHLQAVLPGGTGIMLHCCSAPALWATRPDTAQPVLEHIRQAWQDLGEPTLILACPTCGDTLRKHLPELKTTSLWEVLAQGPLPEGAAPPDAPHALHDPYSAHDQPHLLDAVRKLLANLNAPVEELELSRGKTLCCGYGGLMDAANPDMGREFALRRAGQHTLDYLTYCAMCRDSLSRGGKQVAHLLDYLFPDSPDSSGANQPVSPEPYVRKGPGTADRHENRARLQRTLAARAGRETTVEPWENIALVMQPEVQAAVDSRRILTEDIKRTVHAAENGGTPGIQHDSGRRLASHRPAAVTYWVEYEPLEPGAYRVHRAWCHRMRLLAAEG